MQAMAQAKRKSPSPLPPSPPPPQQRTSYWNSSTVNSSLISAKKSWDLRNSPVCMGLTAVDVSYLPVLCPGKKTLR